MQQRVLITGISGYLGRHVAAELLTQGYEVVGTVRSVAKSEGTRAALAAVTNVDRLSFAIADLTSDDGWDAAMAGCTFVCHVASPFILAEPKDENVMIGPAVAGTTRVLTAAKRAGVRRVVVTSSIVSISAGKPSGRYGTDSWSDTSADIGAYAKSKTLAERAAWEIAADGAFELVAINPGFILGPPLGETGEGTSEALLSDLIGGKMPMVPDIAMGMVDVRDVAALQVAALTAPGANGHRFIASTAEPVEMSHLATVVRAAGFTKAPRIKAPNFMIKTMALFDRSVRAMVPQLGVRVAYDNQATFDVLGWVPTPIETTVVEMATAIAK